MHYPVRVYNVFSQTCLMHNIRYSSSVTSCVLASNSRGAHEFLCCNTCVSHIQHAIPSNATRTSAIVTHEFSDSETDILSCDTFVSQSTVPY